MFFKIKMGERLTKQSELHNQFSSCRRKIRAAYLNPATESIEMRVVARCILLDIRFLNTDLSWTKSQTGLDKFTHDERFKIKKLINLSLIKGISIKENFIKQIHMITEHALGSIVSDIVKEGKVLKVKYPEHLLLPE